MTIRLLRHPVAAGGTALVTLSAVLFLTVLLADLFGLHTNPYLGIVFFLVLPGILLIGLALIPIGAWLERRRRPLAPADPPWPRLDLNDPVQRRGTLILLAMTLANVVIVSLAAYRSVEKAVSAVQTLGA